jgi:excisionase family DNA binding protein
MVTLGPESEYFNSVQAAEFLGVSPGTLEAWRCSKRYPIPYLKCGRLVRYKKADLVGWLNSRTIQPVAVEV